MFIEERHQAILSHIKEYGRISIREIQTMYDVSADSARRDLRILEERKLLRRTHGGAIAPMQIGIRPPRVRDYHNMEIFENYAAIAEHSAALVHENDIVYLTSGSLGFIMLKYLPRDIHYTLVINSAALANELKYWDNIDVYLVGGKMRLHGAASTVDAMAVDFIRQMHFDLCLMTGGGCSAAFGFSNGTPETAAFQRAVIENTQRCVLMMPHQKVGFDAFVRVCGMERFDTLVTDWDALEESLTGIEEMGVEVVVVQNESHKPA